MSELVFRYEYLRGDDYGRLEMAVVTNRFSGQGGFWVAWQDVREFGESLSTYPLDSNAPLKAQWGYGTQDGDNLILNVVVTPANLTGDLLVKVEIADEHDDYRRVRALFSTNYPDLEHFGQSIARLMDGEVDRAVLTGR